MKKISRNTIMLVMLFSLWVMLTIKFMTELHADNLPSASSIFDRLRIDICQKSYWLSVGTTLKRVYGGFFLGAIIAIPLATLMTQLRFLRIIISPIIEILRPIPNVAWVPISIMLLDTIEGSVYFLTFIGALFPIFLNTYNGMRAIPFEFERAAKDLNVNRASYIFEILWPYALPYTFSGLYLGMSGAWLAVIMAEMINGKNGIGYLVWNCYTLVDYAGVVSGMIIIGGLGAVSFLILKGINKRLIFW